MLKTTNNSVVFTEVPDEVSLAINIGNCPIKCPNCHSKFLWNDEGDVLNWESLRSLILKNDGITCVCFLGGDSEPASINALAKLIKEFFNLKVAWYSGRNKLSPEISLKYFDFVKLGPFIKYPLNEQKTNQKFYAVKNNKLTDITYKFWKDYGKSESN
jgi:anaerobic ribonucleoside-triphosphate reductase activating protein